MVRLFRKGLTFWAVGTYCGKRFRVSTGEADIVPATRYKEVLFTLLHEAEHLGVRVDPCKTLESISGAVAKAWQRSPYKME